jgi:HEAT repeat protein
MSDYEEEFEKLVRAEEIEAKLRRAADDPVVEVSQVAIAFLGWRGNSKRVDYLAGRLASGSHTDSLCASLLRALGEIGDPSSLDLALPYTRDPRGLVRLAAICSLHGYREPRALDRLRECLASNDPYTRSGVERAIFWATLDWEEVPFSWRNRFSELLHAAALDERFYLDDRLDWADEITVDRLRVDAYLALMRHRDPEAHETMYHRVQVLEGLREIGPRAAAALPAVETALKDADPDVREAAQLTLQAIRGP